MAVSGFGLVEGQEDGIPSAGGLIPTTKLARLANLLSDTFKTSTKQNTRDQLISPKKMHSFSHVCLFLSAHSLFFPLRLYCNELVKSCFLILLCFSVCHCCSHSIIACQLTIYIYKKTLIIHINMQNMLIVSSLAMTKQPMQVNTLYNLNKQLNVCSESVTA